MFSKFVADGVVELICVFAASLCFIMTLLICTFFHKKEKPAVNCDETESESALIIGKANGDIPNSTTVNQSTEDQSSNHVTTLTPITADFDDTNYESVSNFNPTLRRQSRSEADISHALGYSPGLPPRNATAIQMSVPAVHTTLSQTSSSSTRPRCAVPDSVIVSQPEHPDYTAVNVREAAPGTEIATTSYSMAIDETYESIDQFEAHPPATVCLSLAPPKDVPVSSQLYPEIMAELSASTSYDPRESVAYESVDDVQPSLPDTRTACNGHGDIPPITGENNVVYAVVNKPKKDVVMKDLSELYSQVSKPNKTDNSCHQELAKEIDNLLEAPRSPVIETGDDVYESLDDDETSQKPASPRPAPGCATFSAGYEPVVFDEPAPGFLSATVKQLPFVDDPDYESVDTKDEVTSPKSEPVVLQCTTHIYEDVDEVAAEASKMINAIQQ